MTSPSARGNIILGGDGSDIIEGRGGDDLIDGDTWLNVRISVRANADGTGAEIASFDSMAPMVPLMLDGTYNPGQLKIVREILYCSWAGLRHRGVLGRTWPTIDTVNSGRPGGHDDITTDATMS